jgi:hypothetical protein
MCMFCAAIPMSAALGAAATAKHAEKRRQAMARGKLVRFMSLPVNGSYGRVDCWFSSVSPRHHAAHRSSHVTKHTREIVTV